MTKLKVNPSEGIVLHHAQKNSNDDIRELIFKDVKQLRNWVEDKVEHEGNNIFKKSTTVYIFTHGDLLGNEGDPEIIVTESIGFICDLLSKAEYFGFDLLKEFFLFEFTNYEDAYKTAVDLKEPNPLCYDDSNTLNQ